MPAVVLVQATITLISIMTGAGMVMAVFMAQQKAELQRIVTDLEQTIDPKSPEAIQLKLAKILRLKIQGYNIQGFYYQGVRRFPGFMLFASTVGILLPSWLNARGITEWVVVGNSNWLLHIYTYILIIMVTIVGRFAFGLMLIAGSVASSPEDNTNQGS